MKDKKKLKSPESSKKDTAHKAIKAGLSLLPAGGAAAEFFNSIIVPPLEKRRQQWIEEVTQYLNELKDKKGIDLESLQLNDKFITTVMQATQSAIRNHQREKLVSLRNAILNSALPESPDESLQSMFLNYVDTFTVWHLKILDLFHNPSDWAKRNNHQFQEYYSAGMNTTLESAFPELYEQRSFYDQIWKELYSHGLVSTDSLHGMVTGQSLLNSLTTEMGDKFLNFISNPMES